MRFCSGLALGIWAAVLIGGCTIAQVPNGLGTAAKATVSASPTPAPKTVRTASLVSARTSAAKALDVVSRVGGATLKVRNKIKKLPPVASPKIGRKKPASHGYRILDVSDATDDAVLGTEDATGTVVVDNASGSADEAVVTTAVATSSDGQGDVTQTEQVAVATDSVASETGSDSVSTTTDTAGDVTSGSIDYQPDATASADGQTSEDVQFTVPPQDAGTGNQADVSVSLGVDNSSASAAVTETEQSNGDISDSGTVTMPDGSTFTMAITYHDDGTEDIVGIGSAFSLKIMGISEDMSGTGQVFDRDPGDPNAVVIGQIVLNRGNGTIAFLKDDGTFDTPMPFDFLQ